MFHCKWYMGVAARIIYKNPLIHLYKIILLLGWALWKAGSLLFVLRLFLALCHGLWLDEQLLAEWMKDYISDYLKISRLAVRHF